MSFDRAMLAASRVFCLIQIITATTQLVVQIGQMVPIPLRFVAPAQAGVQAASSVTAAPGCPLSRA
jgi:hypothetical protein